MEPNTIIGNRNNRLGRILILLVSAIGLSGIFFIEPIAQSTQYHQFTDQRPFFGIPNFLNVVSNSGFFLLGIFGVYLLTIKKTVNILQQVRQFYVVLYLGVALVGLGSAYYHIRPGNLTLVWDRLPMTVSFMAFFSIVIAEFISIELGKRLFIPLLLAGLASIGFWVFGELRGTGDLRPYVLVQFLPIILIPVILTCYQSSFNKTAAYWWLLLSYLIAKLFEHFDAEVFQVLGFISGHSLKHLAVATGLCLLLVSYQQRIAIKPSDPG